MCLLFTACSNNINLHDITSENWLFDEGYYLSDVLEFDSTKGHYTVDSQLNLYKNGHRMGRILKCGRRLIIIDTLNKNKGYYEKL